MKKKYFLVDEIKEEYSLFALHTALEDFSLAFALNKHLKANFTRIKENLNYNNSSFEIFNWENVKIGIHCSLISNKQIIESKNKTNSNSLFNISEAKKVSLIKSLPDVDYLIKIKQGLDINHTAKVLNKLPQVVLTYIVDDEEIKSKFNLIFD